MKTIGDGGSTLEKTVESLLYGSEKMFWLRSKNWGKRLVVTKLRTQMEYKWLSQTMRATAVLTKKLTE